MQACGDVFRGATLRQHHRHFEFARGRILEWRQVAGHRCQRKLPGDIAAEITLSIGDLAYGLD